MIKEIFIDDEYKIKLERERIKVYSEGYEAGMNRVLEDKSEAIKLGEFIFNLLDNRYKKIEDIEDYDL